MPETSPRRRSPRTKKARTGSDDLPSADADERNKKKECDEKQQAGIPTFVIPTEQISDIRREKEEAEEVKKKAEEDKKKKAKEDKTKKADDDKKKKAEEEDKKKTRKKRDMVSAGAQEGRTTKKTTAPAADCKKSAIAPNYSEDEDYLISLAFVNVTVDPIRGVGQRSETFWTRVHEKFCLLQQKELAEMGHDIYNRSKESIE
ncbi:hypothetical protein MHU86_15113 [Fragilaria crotonensis]|nr:hypothetical protein MHU86_15113 [Fragilaria crotonensis]